MKQITKIVLFLSIFSNIFFIIDCFHSSFVLNPDILSNNINLLGLKGGIIQISTLNNFLSNSLDFSFYKVPVTP